jgi:hypothetical protein
VLDVPATSGGVFRQTEPDPNAPAKQAFRSPIWVMTSEMSYGAITESPGSEVLCILILGVFSVWAEFEK